jgi:hypothetical protein
VSLAGWMLASLSFLMFYWKGVGVYKMSTCCVEEEKQLRQKHEERKAKEIAAFFCKSLKVSRN